MGTNSFTLCDVTCHRFHGQNRFTLKGFMSTHLSSFLGSDKLHQVGWCWGSGSGKLHQVGWCWGSDSGKLHQVERRWGSGFGKLNSSAHLSFLPEDRSHSPHHPKTKTEKTCHWDTINMQSIKRQYWWPLTCSQLRESTGGTLISQLSSNSTLPT